jgi:hypothetical protein
MMQRQDHISGTFLYCRSREPEHIKTIENLLNAPVVYVAEFRPFYEPLGYKKSISIRRSDSLEGRNFHVQSMKKVL